VDVRDAEPFGRVRSLVSAKPCLAARLDVAAVPGRIPRSRDGGVVRLHSHEIRAEQLLGVGGWGERLGVYAGGIIRPFLLGNENSPGSWPGAVSIAVGQR